MSKTKNIIINILYIILTLGLTVGVLTIFAPCGPNEDGSYMNCHWAGLMIAALGVVLVIQAIAHIFFKNPHARRAVSVSMLPVMILTICIPDKLIHMCMMEEMRCRSIMEPAVTVITVILAAIAVIDIIIQTLDTKQETEE